MSILTEAIAALETENSKLKAELLRMRHFAKKEFERGLAEGQTTQAILEVQGRDRFLRSLSCSKCGCYFKYRLYGIDGFSYGK